MCIFSLRYTDSFSGFFKWLRYSPSILIHQNHTGVKKIDRNGITVKGLFSVGKPYYHNDHT